MKIELKYKLVPTACVFYRNNEQYIKSTHGILSRYDKDYVLLSHLKDDDICTIEVHESIDKDYIFEQLDADLMRENNVPFEPKSTLVMSCINEIKRLKNTLGWF